MWSPEQKSAVPSPRGGWRGRGRGRGRGGVPVGRGWFSTPSAAPGWEKSPKLKSAYTPSPEPPLGPVLFSLTKSDFDRNAETYKAQSAITDCKAVASYNWLDKAEPTISVPGKPARWTPLPESRQLKLDDGEYFRDPNSAYYPDHPIEPAVVATLLMNPDLARRTDVFACGSTLGNLLRFIRGEDRHFRMLVELVGETVFFIRRENSPRELIPDVKGYGHAFPEAYTTWEPVVRGSSSHQRVISYRFGGLRFLARSEGDGYIGGGEDEPCGDGDSPRPSVSHEFEEHNTFDELAAALTGHRVTLAAPEGKIKKLEVLHAGDFVEQEHIFELKTRSVKRKEADTFEDTFGDQLPRLWVAQIPKFVLAYHTRGTFDEIIVRDASNDVSVWERDHADALSRLAALIHHLVGLIRARPDKKLELRHSTVGMLEAREQLEGAGDALSTSVRRLWVGDGGSGCESSPTSEGYHSASEGSEQVDWQDDFEPDYTACSAEDCGYCGRCSY